MPQKKHSNVPEGWEVVDEQPVSRLPDGWEVVSASDTPVSARSIGGFAENVVASGGRFIGDTASGLWSLAKLGGRILQAQNDPRKAMELSQDAGMLLKKSPELIKAVGHALKDRYGSVDAVTETLYTDPVGVLSDLSTVVGGGAVLKLSKAPKIAKAGAIAAKVSDAINPASAVLRVVSPAADLAGDAAIAATVRPGKVIRDDFGGHRGIAKAIKQERVYSDASATRALEASRQEADAMLAAQQAAGTPGVSAQKLVDAVAGEPAHRAALRSDLGIEDTSTQALVDRLIEKHTIPGRPEVQPIRITSTPAPDAVDAAVRATNELGVTQAGQIPSAVFGTVDPAAVKAARELGRNANLVPRRMLGTSQAPSRTIEIGGSPAVPPSMREFPLTDAQGLKREAQDIAYELGKDNETIKSLQQKAIARALREGIEERVPEVAQINERSQRLLGAQRAMAAAEDRPDNLGLKLVVPTAGTSALLDSPRLGAILGIALGDVAKVAGSKATARAALLSRLAGNAEFMALSQAERAQVIQAGFAAIDARE